MPRVESKARVAVRIEEAFALSQSQAEVRYAWDPFVREQRLLDGALYPAKGVRTFTRSRHRLRMTSQYTSFQPPKQVGMRMVEGPPFFATFGGGWSFTAVDETTTDAVWRYTFSIRPAWLGWVANPIGSWFLGRDINRRVAAFSAACTNPELVARAVAQQRAAQ